MANDVTIHLKAQDEASGVFEKAGRRLKALKAESRESGENNITKAFADSGSGVQAVFELLGQGLNAEITERIGEAFEKSSDRLVEMKEQLREGTANAADFANEFAKSLPILGGFVSGFENIRELITGEKAEIEEQNREIEVTNQYYEQLLRTSEKIRDVHRETLEIQAQTAREAKIAEQVGFNRQTSQIDEEAEGQIEAAKKQYQETVDASKNDSGRKNTIAALQAEQKAIAKKMEEAQENGGKSGAYMDVRQTPGGAFMEVGQADNNERLDKLQKKYKENSDQMNNLDAKAASEDAANAAKRDALIAKANEDRRNKQAEAKRVHDNQLSDQQYEHNQRIAQIQAEGVRAALEASGDTYKAQQAGLKDQESADEADAVHRRDIAVREGGDFKSRVTAYLRYWQEINAIRSRYGGQESALVRRQKNEAAEHAEGVDDQLAKGRIDALKQQAAAGNLLAGVEARRLEIQTQFNEKRNSYNKILRDDNATSKEKAEAQRQLQGLDSQEQWALKFANNSERRFALSTMQEAGRTTGVAAKAREENDPMRQMILAAQKSNALLEQIAKNTQPPNPTSPTPVLSKKKAG